ncbi:MAG: hypothetical protein R3A52_09410 [Polyangiales bacterium]
MPQNTNPRDKQLQGDRESSTMQSDKERLSSKQQTGGQVQPSQKNQRIQGDVSGKQGSVSKERSTSQQQGRTQGRKELDPNVERDLIDDDEERQGRFSGEGYKFTK